jgi:predicted Zn-dependent peptidase
LENTFDVYLAYPYLMYGAPLTFFLSPSLPPSLPSQTEAERSAAALDVHVGHFSDPAELPGLAHFCEHMLFLGKKEWKERRERWMERQSERRKVLFTAQTHAYRHEEVSGRGIILSVSVGARR